MYGYIYITVNLINGKKYIGQHKGTFDSNYLGSGKLIRRAIKKYGKDNFVVSILEYAPTKEKLNELEIDYIDKLKKNGVENYNLAKGGNCIGSIYDYMTPEQIEKHKEKISKTPKNRKIEYNEEELEKRRKRAIERNKSLFMKKICVKRNKDRVWRKETLEKMSRKMTNNKINSGKKYINKDGIRKMVLKEELNYYLENGWNLGMGKRIDVNIDDRGKIESINQELETFNAKKLVRRK